MWIRIAALESWTSARTCCSRTDLVSEVITLLLVEFPAEGLDQVIQIPGGHLSTSEILPPFLFVNTPANPLKITGKSDCRNQISLWYSSKLKTASTNAWTVVFTQRWFTWIKNVSVSRLIPLALFTNRTFVFNFNPFSSHPARLSFYPNLIMMIIS